MHDTSVNTRWNDVVSQLQNFIELWWCMKSKLKISRDSSQFMPDFYETKVISDKFKNQSINFLNVKLQYGKCIVSTLEPILPVGFQQSDHAQLF